MPGLFITFEGGEGVGKSTQIKSLECALKKSGYQVVVTREPGGCEAAERIRNLIFSGEIEQQWTPEAETLMMYAARDMHLHSVIAPALKAGKIVLSDRFYDSTRVYQGLVKGVSADLINMLEEKIVKEYKPNITFLLDMQTEESMRRVSKRGMENRHDSEGVEFFEKIRKAFLKIANENTQRFVVIDASKSIEEITRNILSVVKDKIDV